MRITPMQREAIKTITAEIAGSDAVAILFGSRVDNARCGGDVDLMVELPYIIDNPAWLAAQLSAKISRYMDGRSVDILLAAPNLKKLPIHDVAKSTGVML